MHTNPSSHSQVLVSISQLLRNQSFDGELDAFRETFDDYLAKWQGHDPFGRQLLQQTMAAANPLSFQSVSHDRQYLNEQTYLRWRAWLDILPLDMQLGMLSFHHNPRLPCADFSWFHWHQLHELDAHPDAEQAFRLSPLGGWIDAARPGPGSPRQLVEVDPSGVTKHVPYAWSQFGPVIRNDVHCMVNRLLAFQKWAEADELMRHSKVSACSPVTTLMICYQLDSSSYGTVRTTLKQALPLWAAALFANGAATEPGFWQTMVKHGGPEGPCLGPAWDDPARQEALANGRALAPPNLDAVADWLKTPSRLFPEAAAAVYRTCAVWRAQLLEAGLELDRPSGGSTRPRM